MDVARAAGVSQKTVSRVVNGDPHVSAAVQERVREVIATLGYRPNRAARNLVLGRTRTIGLLSVGTTDYGPSALMVGTEVAVRRAGYSLLVVNTIEEDESLISAALADLVDQGVDGIVINEPVGSFTLPTDLVGDRPVLSLSGHYGISTSEIALDADQPSGGRIATQHLLDLGHRTVHHVAGPSTFRSAALRTIGWRDTLVAAGREVPDVRYGDWTSRSGHAVGAELAADPTVTAIFSANDQMGIGVMRALAEAGRRVPEDVSVVGFDDIPEAAYLARALTTVRQDFVGMAGHGVARLVEAIETPRRQDITESYPISLVERETTAPPPPRGI
ncbi:LacI family transcriptional regulator [Paraoerskovia sediminicola]|uniref:LacI family transcriptional regulator n=2 Tax=Paraoerskovia sediminicola TaxID=1138587 RepID=A0ABN6XAA9_9CELL|nr:LacI family transcriptional regulator [Paraoerskovia sediminicola]